MKQRHPLPLARLSQLGHGVALLALLIAIILACGASMRAPISSASSAANTLNSAQLAGRYASTSLRVFTLSSTIDLGGALPAPTGLKAKAGNAQVSLTWNAVKGASGYWIYDRDVTAGQPNYTRLPFPVSSTSSTEKPLINGNEYCFFVTAFNTGGESARSNVACATPSA